MRMCPEAANTAMGTWVKVRFAVSPPAGGETATPTLVRRGRADGASAEPGPHDDWHYFRTHAYPVDSAGVRPWSGKPTWRHGTGLLCGLERPGRCLRTLLGRTAEVTG